MKRTDLDHCSGHPSPSKTNGQRPTSRSRCLCVTFASKRETDRHDTGVLLLRNVCPLDGRPRRHDGYRRVADRRNRRRGIILLQPRLDPVPIPWRAISDRIVSDAASESVRKDQIADFESTEYGFTNRSDIARPIHPHSALDDLAADQSFLLSPASSAVGRGMAASRACESDASLPSIVCSNPLRSVQNVPGPA